MHGKARVIENLINLSNICEADPSGLLFLLLSIAGALCYNDYIYANNRIN